MPYIIGIDLGTTNCGVASVQPDAAPDAAHASSGHQFSVQQLTNPGEVRAETLLPSFLYLPGPNDFPAGSIALPWNEAPSYVVGQLAQKRGAENAGRLVSSAKSWLSHGGVDRTSALLPITAPEGVGKISPLAASRAYLEHIRDAWNHEHPERSASSSSPSSLPSRRRSTPWRAS